MEELPESRATEARPIGPPEARDQPRSLATTIFIGADGLRAGWGLLLFFALYTVLSSGVGVFLHTLHSLEHRKVSLSTGATPADILLAELLLATSTVLATAIMAIIERRPLLGYGLNPDRWLPLFSAGMVEGFAFLSLLVLILRETSLLAFTGKALSGRSAVGFGLYWLAAFLAVGFFEEIFFRGYMQFTLTRGLAGIFGWFGVANRQALGFWTAAFLLSFGFGFTHRTNSGESPVGLLAAALIGLAFCLSLWRTGSLWWAIGLHASWDWAQSYFYGVPDSGTLIAGHLYATHPVGKLLLSGGQTGPEGSVYVIPVIVLIAFVIRLTLPRTHTGYAVRDASAQPAALDLA